MFIYCRKFNAEFNKLIKQKVTVLVFLNKSTFANNFDFIFIFSLIMSLSYNETLKLLGL